MEKNLPHSLISIKLIWYHYIYNNKKKQVHTSHMIILPSTIITGTAKYATIVSLYTSTALQNGTCCYS